MPSLGSGTLPCSLLSSPRACYRDLSLTFTLPSQLPSLFPVGFPCRAQHSPTSPCLSPCDNPFLSNIHIPFIPPCSSSLLGCVSWKEKCSFASSTSGQSLVLKPVKSYPKPAFPLKQTVQRRLGFTTHRLCTWQLCLTTASCCERTKGDLRSC